jgi:Arc/MetJ-type ribon-helix-helix transcriptional regulator
MRSISVRLPETVVADLEAESRRRRISKSEVVRERLRSTTCKIHQPAAPLDAIADLIGSVDGLPADLSARKKRYLRAAGAERKRPR